MALRGNALPGRDMVAVRARTPREHISRTLCRPRGADTHLEVSDGAVADGLGQRGDGLGLLDPAAIGLIT